MKRIKINLVPPIEETLSENDFSFKSNLDVAYVPAYKLQVCKSENCECPSKKKTSHGVNACLKTFDFDNIPPNEKHNCDNLIICAVIYPNDIDKLERL